MANFMKVKNGNLTMLINVDQVCAVIEGSATTCTVQFSGDHRLGVDMSVFEFMGYALDAVPAPKK